MRRPRFLHGPYCSASGMESSTAYPSAYPSPPRPEWRRNSAFCSLPFRFGRQFAMPQFIESVNESPTRNVDDAIFIFPVL